MKKWNDIIGPQERSLFIASDWYLETSYFSFTKKLSLNYVIPFFHMLEKAHCGRKTNDFSEMRIPPPNFSNGLIKR